MKINKKELIEKISKNQDQLPHRDIELAVKTVISCMTKALSTGERIAVVSKTIAYDIGTTSELGAGK